MAGGTEISSLCSDRTVKMFLKSEKTNDNEHFEKKIAVLSLTFLLNGSKEHGIHLKSWHLGQIEENINTQFVLSCLGGDQGQSS